MLSFERYSLYWVIGLIALIAVIYIVRAVLGYRAVARDAEDDFDYKTERNMLDPDIPRSVYVTAYRRVHSPRHLAYVAGGVVAMLVLTPLAIAVYNMVAAQIWIANDRPPIYAPHGFVWAFFMFFGLIGIWAIIAYMTANRYHKRAPRSFKQELIKARH